MIELLAHFPPLPHSWRLDLFQRLLLLLPILLGYYCLHRYPWVIGLALQLVFMTLIVGLTGLVQWLLGRFFDRSLRRLRLAGTLRRRQVRFMLVALIVTSLVWWGTRNLAISTVQKGSAHFQHPGAEAR